MLAAALIAIAVAAVDPALIDQLDHPDLQQRDAATAAIAATTSLEWLEGIEDAMARPDLSPEQRLRLHDAATRVFNNRERGGLGVSFAGNRRDGTVEIGNTIAGFPARDVLEPGDVVVSIDGMRLRGTAHMRWIILSKEPADLLEMTILRPGPDNTNQRLVVPVPLGRYANLNNAQGLNPADLRAAYDIRLARRGIEPDSGMSETIGRTLDPVEWLKTEGFWPADDAADPTPANANTARPAGTDISLSVAVGGQPQGVSTRDALRAADANFREGQLNSSLTRMSPDEAIREAVAVIRVNARRVIEIDRRLHTGVGRNRRVSGLDGLRREREQLVELLRRSIPTLRDRAATVADPAGS